jgi:hypothetical protein
MPRKRYRPEEIVAKLRQVDGSASTIADPADDPEAHRPHCLAEVVGLELKNVGTKYPFERSYRFPGIQPNSRHRDYSRLSCRV